MKSFRGEGGGAGFRAGRTEADDRYVNAIDSDFYNTIPTSPTRKMEPINPNNYTCNEIMFWMLGNMTMKQDTMAEAIKRYRSPTTTPFGM